MSTEGIYKFHENYGRMGKLDGVFIATDDAVAALMGETVYFGEVLGKHSEIDAEINSENTVLLTNHPETVAAVKAYGICSGVNPFDYYEADDSDDDDPDD